MRFSNISLKGCEAVNKKWIDLIINNFITHSEYSVFEYKNVNSNESLWGLKRSFETKQHYIVFGILKDISELKDSIKGCSLADENTHITYVLFNDSNLDIQMLERLKYYISDSHDNTLILINEMEESISYFDPQIEEFAKVIQSILTGGKRAKAPREKQDIFTVTNMVILANIVMYILTAYLSGSILDSHTSVLIYLGAKHNELIRAGQYYRLITAMFLHGGILHIALNMYALKSIGPLIENIYGKWKFILTYFISGITSSLFSYYFSPAISVGASGAIFGLMGAALVLGIKMRHKIGRGFLRSILQVVVVNLFLGFGLSNVDNFGHLGGLIGGLIITSLFYIKIRKK